MNFSRIALLELGLTLGLSFLVVACSNGPEGTREGRTGVSDSSLISSTTTPVSKTTAVTQVTYQDVVDKVFTPSCFRCHSGSSPKGRLDLSDPSKFMNKFGLVITNDAQNSSLYQAIATDSLGMSDMPPDNPLSESQIELVKNWIDQGAQGINLPTIPTKPTTPTSPGLVTFQDVVDNVLDVCASCHGSAITDYQVLMNNQLVTPKDPDNSYLYNVVKKNSAGKAKMPPKKPLSDDAIAILRQWILDGANP